MKNKKKRQKFKPKQRQENISYTIDKLDRNSIGKIVQIECITDRVSQTSGPTLFSVSDGTGSFMLKGFASKPGERSYPEINSEDYVSAKIKINEYNNALEGEILFIKKLNEGETQTLIKKMKALLRERSKPINLDFMIKSKILEKLKPSMLKAATEIKLAIMQSRPIIVRHHNDADGYAAGYSLEKAIIPLIEEQHGGGKSAWEFYTRAPCSAPFYEIDDSIRDTANSLRNVAKFSNKMPLVVITDNGSSREDLMGIKQGKIHGMEFIVIDHHYFDEDVISPEVLVHVNPFLVGEDGQRFSAGMLCAELARMIYGVENIEQIAAMAGLADRIDLLNADAVNQYVKLAEGQGYSKKLLSEISTVIDFVSAKLRFMEAREYIETIFGEPRAQQRKLVGLMAPYINGLDKKGLEMAKSGATIEKLGKVTLQLVEVDKTFPGFGFFPKPGRAVGLVHDFIQKDKKLDRVVTVGVMNTAITIRATDKADFSVHELINEIKKKVKDSFAEGGGHKNAGSINFLPSKKEDVLKVLRDFVKK